jgi:hypothetical protein
MSPVAELEPGACEGVGILIGIVAEAARYLVVDRVYAKRHVRRRHHRRNALAGRVGGGREILFARVHRRPLLRAGRASGKLPLIIEQQVEIVAVPADRVRRPGAFEPAGDRMVGNSALVAAGPAQALLGDVGALRFGADLGRIARAVALAEGVTAGDERDRLLVVHAHSAERLADVAGRLRRVGVTARTLRVDVDEPHLHRCERVLESLARILVDPGLAQPLLFGAPEDVLLRLPAVDPAAAEAEHRPAHGFDRHVAREDHQVCPRELAAVLLLDRPEQAPCLVEVCIVRPAVERRETLPAGGGAAAPVTGAVGARAVPCHADEEGPVMSVVGWPPGLAVGHQRGKVALQRLIVERPEFGGIIEIVAHRIGRCGSVLMEDVERELVRPPVAIGSTEKRSERGRLLRRAAERAVAGLRVHIRVSPRLNLLPDPAPFAAASEAIYITSDRMLFRSGEFRPPPERSQVSLANKHPLPLYARRPAGVKRLRRLRISA